MRALASSLLVLILLGFAVPATWAASPVTDTDGDGLVDSEEDRNMNGKIDANETDPKKADTDGGGEADGSERTGQRNPFDPADDLTQDQDGDLLINAEEIARGTDPKKADTDGDGAKDGADPFPLEEIFQLDDDRDGMADEWEFEHEFSPSERRDAEMDTDGDGISNREEFVNNIDPRSMDTDRDGVGDSQEMTNATDPEISACLRAQDAGYTFGDMESHWAKDAVQLLSRVQTIPSHRAIAEGYVVGNGMRAFKPDQPVTRFEFLKLALASSCVTLVTERPEWQIGLKDLPPASEADQEMALRRRTIVTAIHYGIVQGYVDGTFRPDAPVSRAEALKILLYATRLQKAVAPAREVPAWTDVKAEDWFFVLAQKAARLQIIKGYDDLTFRPGNPITRAEAATIILRAIRKNTGVNHEVLPPETPAAQ